MPGNRKNKQFTETALTTFRHHFVLSGFSSLFRNEVEISH